MRDAMFKDYLTYIKITQRSGDSPRGRVMGRGSLCCWLPAALPRGLCWQPCAEQGSAAPLPARQPGTSRSTPGCSREARLLEGGSRGPPHIPGFENLEIQTLSALREVVVKPKQT